MIADVIWGLIIGVVLAYVAYRLLYKEPERPKPLPFDPEQQPYVLLARPDSEKDSPFVLTAKRIAYELGVPVKEVTPDASPYPLPSHLSAVVFQGRWLWFTKNTFDRELYRFSLVAAKTAWESYIASYKHMLSRSPVVAYTSKFSANVSGFSYLYGTAYVIHPSDYTVTDEGEVTMYEPGIKYSPYFIEELRRIGYRTHDIRSFAPYKEYVFVVRPRTVEEQM